MESVSSQAITAQQINPILFFLFAGLAIFMALMVVLKKNPVSSALSLVFTFFCFAALYALLGAHLVAAMQVLVYAGAIMVLFVFVIMLLAQDAPSFDLGRTHAMLRVGAWILGVVLALVIIQGLRISPSSAPAGVMTAAAISEQGGNTRAIAKLMFSDYILPFELTSVLLLGAIVGAVAIAKRKNTADHKKRSHS